MNRGPNEKRFLTMMGVPEWCGESESREALYGFLVGAINRHSVVVTARGSVYCEDQDQLAESSPAEPDKVQEKAVSGREKGKPGRKRKAKK